MLAFPKPRPRALDRKESRYDLEKRYRATSKEVRELDGHLCRVCLGPGNETHHAERRSTAPERYTDVTNLITVCKKNHGDGGCHQLLTDNILKLRSVDASQRINTRLPVLVLRWCDDAKDYVQDGDPR